ncbi:restriction endonuclease subunit S [Bacillus pseudomycoides]|uniref:restriction endonuclease subunit S n=1 Tax=Bacillus pseudomycoides TaxID=64104 RepID=UPI000BF03EC5|nr:restriction endonuclease subunit S [Bacillus pseudomycoides]PEI52005.1 restriction endonuclease subunit S [Bacillus pseudomycoides]PGA70807.1 restriction endonuclease subunit S [Bacillus pseudomycoides]PHE10635.1 restriction endonuclease subunit S [Bacillus pseudomycoides]PHE91109.1 restriction endonuclease subunit S [Bacillus pseudomycoides]
MASKKKAKTLDELLEEAVVPEEEQPYGLSKGWVWIKLSNLITLLSGRDITPSKCNDIGKGIPYVMGASNFHRNDLVVERWIEEPTVVGLKGDILLSVKGTVGKILIQSHEKLHLSRQVMGIRTSQFLNNKYLLYFFKTYINVLKENAKGLIPGISRDDILNIKLPFPPLNEQLSIVNQIEEMLAKVDDAQQLIEEAKETFELRRAAILENAFNFYETEELKQLKDVCTIKNGYAFKSKDFSKDGFQLIRMGNLYKNRLDLTRNPVYLPIEYDKKIIEKYMVKNGDILLTLTGTKYKRDYGYAVKIGNMAENLLLNQRIMSLTPNSKDDYIFYYLQTNEFRNNFFSFETGGVNQGNVGSKAVPEIYIPWHNDEIRKEIVQSIKVQLAKEAQSLGILQIQQSIELIKQSILSKAFKGELGTNDPNDEPAIELLKSILQEKL